MPETAETTAVGAPRVRIVESLVRLGKAVQKSMIYPEGHPAIPAAVQLFFEGLRQAAEDRPSLSLGVLRDRILVDGEPVDAKNAALAWLAQQMYDRGIGALELSRSIPEADGVRFVLWLAKPPATPEPGAADALPQFEGITLTRYDFAKVRFGEDPAADHQVRTDPTRVWLVLMGGLLGGGDWDLASGSMDDPEELARQVSARLASGQGETTATVASRVIAMGTQISELTGPVREDVKAKIGKFIGGLTPELRSELLRVDPRSSRQKLEFVTEMVDALPDTTVLEILGNLDRTGAHIPHQFITLMNKLIGISTRDSTLQGQVGEKLETMGLPKTLLQTHPDKMRGVLEEVLQTKLEGSWNPEKYQALLESLSMRKLSGTISGTSLARYGDPGKPEDVRAHVSEIALRLLVAAPESEEAAGFVKCLDDDAPRALEAGRFDQLHEAASAVKEIAVSGAVLPQSMAELTETYLAGFSKEDRIETILSAAIASEGPLPESLTGLFRIAGSEAGYAAFQRLAVLAECPESGRLVELLLALDQEEFAATVARLRTDGWTSLRPLFPVLLKIGGGRALDLALTFLGNEDARVRLEAYRVLLIADQRPAQVERYIERGLADESSKVVGFVIAQAKLRAGPEIAALLGAYLSRPSRQREEDLSLRAIGALAAYRTDQSRDILIGLLKARKITFWVKEVRVNTALEEALTQIGDGPATEAVKEWRRSAARWISMLLVQGKVKK